MRKRMAPFAGLMLLLLAAAGFFGVRAGNRADINADRAVNATDLTTLSNILAGNIDLSNYNLANVVVVAPQGGDFTNPCDAADWVSSQSPGPAKRFVILITPGSYYIDRTLDLSAYTSLIGYGPEQSLLIKNSGKSSASPPFGAVVSATESSYAGEYTCIAGLGLYNEMAVSAAGQTCAAIYICGSELKIRECIIKAAGLGDRTMGIYATASEGPIGTVSIDDSRIEGCGRAGSTGNAHGIYFNGLPVEIHESKISAYTYQTGLSAVCLDQDQSGSSISILNVYNSIMDSSSITSGNAWYYYRLAGGSATFFYSRLYGLGFTGTNVIRLCCNDGTAMIP